MSARPLTHTQADEIKRLAQRMREAYYCDIEQVRLLFDYIDSLTEQEPAETLNEYGVVTTAGEVTPMPHREHAEWTERNFQGVAAVVQREVGPWKLVTSDE